MSDYNYVHIKRGNCKIIEGPDKNGGVLLQFDDEKETQLRTHFLMVKKKREPKK